MDAAGGEGSAGGPEDHRLVLDELGERFETFQLFRDRNQVATDAVLDELGAQTEVDLDIVQQLSSRHPLDHPGRFEEAHALTVRALEVLDRNGARKARLPRLGILTPVARWFVQLVARFLVRQHLSAVIDDMRRLYTRRWANCARDDPSWPLLDRVRGQTDLLAPGFKRNPLGIPTFLLGGAVVSSTTGLLRDSLRWSEAPRWQKVVAAAVAYLLFAAASWVVLRGAAVARRRIRLTVEKPLLALWQTIGNCGMPPRDQTRQFSFIAIVLLILAWFVIPFAVLAATNAV